MTEDIHKARSILLVGTDLSGGGGVNRVIRDLADILSERLKLDVTVLSGRSGSFPTYPYSPNVNIEYYPRGKRLLLYLLKLVRMRLRGYDFVVGFWPHDNIILSLTFILSRTKLILCEHASWYHPPLYIRFLRNLFYPLAYRVPVLNPAEKEHYARWLNNVTMLPNPVAFLTQDQPLSREKLIIAVGHIEAWKNFADAIIAMKAAALEEEGWSLTIIGDGSEKDELNLLIEQLNLERTTIEPPTSTIEDWYSRASIMLVTSTIEVFSLVLAEGIGAGVVPVAYAADGPSYILEDYPEHLVPIGDVEGLADKLRAVALSDRLPQLSKMMSSSIRTRFSPDAVAAKWKELLR